VPFESKIVRNKIDVARQDRLCSSLGLWVVHVDTHSMRHRSDGPFRLVRHCFGDTAGNHTSWSTISINFLALVRNECP
jgi:hypothetical protein